MVGFNKNLLALLASASAVAASPVDISKRDVLSPLPENAYPDALKFQPYMDFDTDSCYQTAAVDPDGNTNPGLQHKNTGITENCRKVNRLDNSNTYSRQRCNGGWCAIMYEYYFEKDVVTKGSPVDGGHRHDWENVVVFTQNGELKGVATSCHSGYGNAEYSPRTDGTHPLVVYHKDGVESHCIRTANDGEDPENDKGVWFRAPLVGWNGWPGSTRDSLNEGWPGGVGPKLDFEFGDKLFDAMITFQPTIVSRPLGLFFPNEQKRLTACRLPTSSTPMSMPKHKKVRKRMDRMS